MQRLCIVVLNLKIVNEKDTLFKLEVRDFAVFKTFINPKKTNITSSWIQKMNGRQLDILQGETSILERDKYIEYM